MRAVPVEAPETLRRVGFDPDDGEAGSVGQRRRRVLTLRRVSHPYGAPRRDVVAEDVRLAVDDGRIEESGARGEEERLVVISRTVRDVRGRAHHRTTIFDREGGQVDVAAGRTLGGEGEREECGEHVHGA